jgi:chromosome condensin MukBEF ATPase and DNA-binding subunit MukB
MAESFLKRFSPCRVRQRTIEWPFQLDGVAAPRVDLHVLGALELEQAYFAAQDHFKTVKQKVAPGDYVFVMRERIELVWRAYREFGTSSPLAATADELAAESDVVIGRLYSEWSALQRDADAQPVTAEQMTQLIEELKKNTQTALLDELSSTSLKELARTLVAQPPSSPAPSERG